MENLKNNIPFDTKAMLEALPVEERKPYLEVWELAAIAQPELYLPPDEKLASWQAVQSRMEAGQPDSILDTDTYIESLADADHRRALSEVWELAGGVNRASTVQSSKSEAWESIRSQISDSDSSHTHTQNKTAAHEANVTRLGNKTKTARKITSAPQAKDSRVYWLVAAVLSIGIAVWMWQLMFSSTVYTAPFGEVVSVELDDRTSVQLNSGSELRLQRGFGDSHRNVELAGEAFFDVEHGDVPFLVHTSNAVVQVLGTSFNVRSWPGTGTSETTVALTQGSIELLSSDEPGFSQLLEPGEISRVRGVRTMPERVQALRIDEVLAWRSSNIAFNATRLIDAAAEIERRFNVPVSVDNASAAQKTVTGFYQTPDNPEGILEDLASIAGLQLTFTNGKYTLK